MLGLVEEGQRRRTAVVVGAGVVLLCCAVTDVTRAGAGASHAQEPVGLRAVERGGAARQAVSFPGPGWRFASPRTRITFQGATVEALRDLTVTGSSTGTHEGSIHALRLGTGAVFRPRAPFAAGERVEVRLRRRVHGARGRSFSFRIADKGGGPPHVAPPLPTVGRRNAARLRQPRLRTMPVPRPPGRYTARGTAGPAGQRRIFVSPRPPSGVRRRKPALMILDGRGRLLWYEPRATVVHDLQRTVLNGRPVLAYYVRRHRAPNFHEVIDHHYRVVARVFARNGYEVNAHELQLTPSGTAYVGIYDTVRIPGTRRRAIDFVIQEIDVKTRDVLFEWHSLDHVPTSASYTSPPADGTPWDYFHGNSIEPPGNGSRTIVVSARKTSAVYGIDRVTGELRWILGGAQDQFHIVDRHPAWRFCAQHDARRLSNGDLSLFDNGGAALSGGSRCPIHTARVLRFKLDERRKEVRLIRSISSRSSSDDGSGYRPTAVGSARWQPNGDVLVNWGNTGRVTQVTPAGGVRFKLQLAHWTYRATRAIWSGRPGGRPAVAARRRRGGEVDVYASWNGATNVVRWRILTGAAPDDLHGLGRSFAWKNLETRMCVRTAARYYAVQAVNRARRVVGESVPVQPR
jgi:hypothetical protein